jgi:hypothetical protein
VFWDAHGVDVAESLFGHLLPALPAENKVVVDDIWTTPDRYGLHAEFQAGPLWSLFDELPPLWEYLTERQIEFDVGNRWISFTARYRAARSPTSCRGTFLTPPKLLSARQFRQTNGQ